MVYCVSQTGKSSVMPRSGKGHMLIPYTRSMAGTAQLVPCMILPKLQLSKLHVLLMRGASVCWHQRALALVHLKQPSNSHAAADAHGADDVFCAAVDIE